MFWKYKEMHNAQNCRLGFFSFLFFKSRLAYSWKSYWERGLWYLSNHRRKEGLRKQAGEMTEAGWQGANQRLDLTASLPTYQSASCAAVETVSLKSCPQVFQSRQSLPLWCQQQNSTISGVIFETSAKLKRKIHCFWAVSVFGQNLSGQKNRFYLNLRLI